MALPSAREQTHAPLEAGGSYRRDTSLAGFGEAAVGLSAPCSAAAGVLGDSFGDLWRGFASLCRGGRWWSLATWDEGFGQCAPGGAKRWLGWGGVVTHDDNVSTKYDKP
eukprot:Skav234086  [mRNA]  locus=scaffold212:91750:92076:- [translate_table: standard]